MAHVCPWWITWTFDNRVRRLVHDADRLLRPLVRESDNVADIGCGQGYFTVALANLVGRDGHVQAVDLQQEQLDRVQLRTRKAGLAERVTLVQATRDRLGLRPPLDFVLAFWMAHEVPDQPAFFTEVHNALRPGGSLLVVEPLLHVRRVAFDRTVANVERCELATVRPLRLALSRAMVFERR